MQSLRLLLFSIERRMRRRHKQGVILLVDALIVPVTFLLVTMLVYGSVWPDSQITRLAPLFPALGLLGGMASLAFGLPKIKLKTYASLIANGVGYYAATVTFGTVILTFLPGMRFPVIGIITFAMAVFLAAIVVRIGLLRLLLWALSAGRSKTRVLIYGAGTTGLQLASALQSQESVFVVAFIDDDHALHSQKLLGKRIYSSRYVEKIAQDYDISRVLLAMPSLSAPKLAQITRKLQGLGLSVQALPSFAQLIGAEELVENLSPVASGNLLGRGHLDEALDAATSDYSGKSILVSGAGGSVGAELCRQLLQHEPSKLVLYEVSEPALYMIERDLRELLADGQTEIVPVLGSVTDARMVRQVLTRHRIDTIFHAAAYKHVPLVEQNALAGVANNVFGTRTLVDAAIDEGVGRFILISTDKAVRPRNVMGATKRLAEMVVQDRARRAEKTRFSIVRFGNVLGSSGSVIPLFRDQIARGGPVTLTHEDVTRYFMTIAEASKLVLLAGSFHDPVEGEDSRVSHADVFVLDMGKPIRIRQLAEQMIQGAGYTVRDEANPNGDIEIVVIGLRPGEKLHEELLIGQGMLTTPHPKILRAAEESLTELEMAHALRELAGFMATGDVEAARGMALELVRPRQERAATAAQAT